MIMVARRAGLGGGGADEDPLNLFMLRLILRGWQEWGLRYISNIYYVS
jgi:hypothetical protein